jgi:hypothetical protein
MACRLLRHTEPHQLGMGLLPRLATMLGHHMGTTLPQLATTTPLPRLAMGVEAMELLQGMVDSNRCRSRLAMGVVLECLRRNGCLLELLGLTLPKTNRNKGAAFNRRASVYALYY